MQHKRSILSVLLLMIGVVFFSISCKKEAALTPETVYDGAPKLPQGLSKYDTTIQHFYDSTGTYIMYKFSNEGDYRFFVKGVAGIGILLPPAVLAVQVDSSKQGDIDTLNMAVDYVINTLLRKNYSNKLLRQLLPYKILLYKYGRALTVNNAKPTGFDTATVATSLLGGPTLAANLSEGFNCLGMGIIRQASSFSFPTGYTAANAKIFHQLLWVGGGTTQTGTNGAVGKGRIPIPDAFKVTDYGALTAQWNALPQPRSGISVDSLCMLAGTLVYQQNALSDYSDFIKKMAGSTNSAFESLYLTATADPKGLRRKKRDAIVSFFKNEYGYDIENAWNR